MKESKPLFKIGVPDLLKGFVVSILMIVLTGLTTSLANGCLPDYETFKTLLLTGLGAGIAYIIKNLFSNSEGDFAKTEPK